MIIQRANACFGVVTIVERLSGTDGQELLLGVAWLNNEHEGMNNNFDYLHSSTRHVLMYSALLLTSNFFSSVRFLYCSSLVFSTGSGTAQI
jgi:hypothetical protein